MWTGRLRYKVIDIFYIAGRLFFIFGLGNSLPLICQCQFLSYRERNSSTFPLSFNFLYATQSKAMLKLHGEGDPTGRGEGFSFIRVSMKDIFIKADEDYETKLAEAEKRPKSHHKYNVQEQQKVYKSEIDRIWKAQFRALSKREPPQLDRDDEAEEKRKKAAEAAIQAKQYGRQVTPAGPSGSRAESLERDGSLGPDGGRVLRIKRCVSGICFAARLASGYRD